MIVCLVVTLITIAIMEMSITRALPPVDIWTFAPINCGLLYAIIGFALTGSGQEKDTRPICKVTFANASFAKGMDDHGLILTLRGTKPATFSTKQVSLNVEGDALWKAVGSGASASLVTLAKWSFLPLSLCPKYMSSEDIAAGRTDFKCQIGIGTKQNGSFGAKHETILTKLNEVKAKGDPEFSLIFDTDERRLFTITTKPSKLIQSLNANSTLTSFYVPPEEHKNVEDKSKEEMEPSVT